MNSLVDAERQIMLWEKRTQIAKETKATVDADFGQGEIAVSQTFYVFKLTIGSLCCM